MGASIQFEGWQKHSVANDVVPDFLDGRGDDGGGVFGMAEFEVHTAAHVLQLEHRAAPGRAGNSDLHRFWTEAWMPGNERFAAAEEHRCVKVVHRLDFENRVGRKIAEKDAAFDFRPDNAAVDLVRQIRVRVKHTDAQTQGYRFFGAGTRGASGQAGNPRACPLEAGWVFEVAEFVDEEQTIEDTRVHRRRAGAVLRKAMINSMPNSVSIPANARSEA